MPAQCFQANRKTRKRVVEEIKAEIARLRADGIDKSCFQPWRGNDGDSIRIFNSTETIAMQLVGAPCPIRVCLMK